MNEVQVLLEKYQLTVDQLFKMGLERGLSMAAMKNPRLVEYEIKIYFKDHISLIATEETKAIQKLTQAGITVEDIACLMNADFADLIHYCCDYEIDMQTINSTVQNNRAFFVNDKNLDCWDKIKNIVE